MPKSKDPEISAITGKPKARRGFACMDPERRREIARKGGGSVPPEKRSFARDRALAASAGAKGGEASGKSARHHRTGRRKPADTIEMS